MSSVRCEGGRYHTWWEVRGAEGREWGVRGAGGSGGVRGVLFLR